MGGDLTKPEVALDSPDGPSTGCLRSRRQGRGRGRPSFRVGVSRDGLLVKFYVGEEYSEEELLANFEKNTKRHTARPNLEGELTRTP